MAAEGRPLTTSRFTVRFELRGHDDRQGNHERALLFVHAGTNWVGEFVCLWLAGKSF